MATKKILLAFLVVAAANIGAVAATISVYVSDSAGSDDSGDGSFAAPYKTIAKARDYVRTLPKNGDEIFIEVRSGTYRLTEALTFDSQDSGIEGAPITYRAYNDEEVTLIGGTTIGGWSSVTEKSILDLLKPEAKTNVRVADLGSLDLGTIEKRGFYVVPTYSAAMELFFKDEPMQLARYPNTDFMILFNSMQGDYTFTFKPEDDNLALWQQESDPHAMGYWNFEWAEEYTSLSNFVASGDRISATIGYRPIFDLGNNTRFYLLNFLCELDSPGEYYVDRTSSKLYFWPPTTDYVANDFVVSVLENIIVLDQASFINFEGFILTACRREAIVSTSVNDINFYGLTIRNIGTDGISVTTSSNVLIDRCLVENVGDTGVKLSGGDRDTLTRANITARNNEVRKFGRWCKTYKPAFKVEGVGITIEHNDMHDGPHNAIWFFGNYHTFQYNRVHNVAQETQDVGAFYSGLDWTYRGTVIKHNMFYDILGYEGKGAVGVYLDDQFSSAEIVGNVFLNVKTAIMFGGGRDNFAHNNIIINVFYGFWIDSRGTGACGPMNNVTLYQTLEKVPIQSDLWATTFPELAAIYDNNPNAPVGNKVGTNIIINSTKDYLLCTEESVSPYLTFLDDCALTTTDFFDVNSLNFTLKAGVTDTCSDAFKQAFKDIPLDMIGIIPLPAQPVAPVSAPSASPSASPNANSPNTQTVSQATMSSLITLSAIFLAVMALLV